MIDLIKKITISDWLSILFGISSVLLFQTSITYKHPLLIWVGLGFALIGLVIKIAVAIDFKEVATDIAYWLWDLLLGIIIAVADGFSLIFGSIYDALGFHLKLGQFQLPFVDYINAHDGSSGLAFYLRRSRNYYVLNYDLGVIPIELDQIEKLIIDFYKVPENEARTVLYTVFGLCLNNPLTIPVILLTRSYSKIKRKKGRYLYNQLLAFICSESQTKLGERTGNLVDTRILWEITWLCMSFLLLKTNNYKAKEVPKIIDEYKLISPDNLGR